MNSKEFKSVFDTVAKASGFAKAFGGWFKESSECIAVLELQKSNFGDYYMLNIKIFIQGAFGYTYFPNKDLIKSPMGDVTANETQEYKDVLDFDEPMDDVKRKEKLEMLFKNRILPFVNKTLTKNGIIELAKNGELSLLPAVKKELGLY
jgi:hypothetical protein